MAAVFVQRLFTAYLPPIWGYFAFCIAAAVVIAAIPATRGRTYNEESAAIGTSTSTPRPRASAMCQGRSNPATGACC